ncbi:uncharacterized protein MYCFIDRAFT_198164 [Pseudocercospora fijiensis CIRAD86]|uniref:Transglycosylase SLT domain-containing protein n=1 Tax=Pseudocercospora fijiensis (strain CIRAD86) TaxID=383855 RepID=M2YUM4_PSEFD|nr:uncharacterized protein MYCFIDRAFT_198164 [Pseudocercospora fijiensis CIRAD86]EME81440.1 hypothetical protein MYCFIDRAFT_198164 [Pseudocercospora fijiensis CIRAD86]
MAHGKGNLCKKAIALFLLACIAATILAVSVVYIPKLHHHHHHRHQKGSGKQDNSSNDDDIESKGLDIQVKNAAAFDNGGASKNPSAKDNGVGAGKDEYTLYAGEWDTFPKKEDWVSFDDMWNINKNKTIKTACEDHGWGENNADDETQDIYDAIQSLAKNSSVDNRFILAIVLQESKGCVRVNSTNIGVHNLGLMQSRNGTTYNPENRLVQYLDQYPDAYSAARAYNSGAVAASGDLSDAMGAAKCYASDVANRLTGWVKAESRCGNGGAQSDGNIDSQGATQTTTQTTTPSTKHSTTQTTTSTSNNGQWHPDSAADSGQWVPDSVVDSGQWVPDSGASSGQYQG